MTTGLKHVIFVVLLKIHCVRSETKLYTKTSNISEGRFIIMKVFEMTKETNLIVNLPHRKLDDCFEEVREGQDPAGVRL